MKPLDWYADEQSRRSIDEVRRLWLRGRRRPVLFALMVAVMLGGYAYKKSRKPFELNTARAIFIVREYAANTGGQRGLAARPPTALMMQEHLGKVLFNRTNLLEVMRKTEVYGEFPAREPEKAIHKFKEWSGFALKDNGFGDTDEVGPRSAKLYLKFTHPDPVMASLVVETMARSLHDLETRSREAYYDAAAGLAEGRLREEQALVTKLEGELARIRHSDRNARQVMGPGRASTLEKVQGVLRSMGSNDVVTTEREAWDALARLQRSHTRGLDEILIRGEEINESVIAMRVQIEAGKLRIGELSRALKEINLSRAQDRRTGIRFDLVDSNTIAITRPLGPLGLGLHVFFAFLVLVPLCGILIGAFDAKVYSTDDLHRLGVKVLGAIPTFQGDRVASLRERMKSPPAASQTR